MREFKISFVFMILNACELKHFLVLQQLLSYSCMYNSIIYNAHFWDLHFAFVPSHACFYVILCSILLHDASWA